MRNTPSIRRIGEEVPILASELATFREQCRTLRRVARDVVVFRESVYQYRVQVPHAAAFEEARIIFGKPGYFRKGSQQWELQVSHEVLSVGIYMNVVQIVRLNEFKLQRRLANKNPKTLRYHLSHPMGKHNMHDPSIVVDATMDSRTPEYQEELKLLLFGMHALRHAKSFYCRSRRYDISVLQTDGTLLSDGNAHEHSTGS